MPPVRGQLQVRRKFQLEDYREDVESQGYGVSARDAADRAGCTKLIATRILVPMHKRMGHSNKLIAHILGVNIRTVERY